MLRVLVFLVSLGARALRAMCRRRADLVIENLALRQQVTALKKERPRPPLMRWLYVTIARYFEFFNDQRPHKALGYQTPARLYDGLVNEAA